MMNVKSQRVRKFPGMQYLAVSMLLGLTLAAWDCRGWSRMPRKGLDSQMLRKLAHECPGWIVFQRERRDLSESIFVAPVGSRWIRRLASGRYPRWSPDGRWIAFFQGSNVCVMTAEGRGLRRLTTTRVAEPHALEFHPSGQEVWFTDGNDLRAVDWAGRSRVVLTNVPVRGIGFSGDGRRVMLALAGHRIAAAQVETDGVLMLGPVLHRGCSAAISPDGQMYTHLGGRHDVLRVRDWHQNEVRAAFTPPEGCLIDDETWSNHMRWLVCRSEWPGPADVWILDLATTGMVRVTSTGDAYRPDLWVAFDRQNSSGWVGWWLRRSVPQWAWHARPELKRLEH